MEVFIVGDLHGQVDNFRRAFQQADLATHPRRHLVVQELIHSSFRYPAGGDKSHQLVDLVAALVCQFPHRVHYLPGNHEIAQWTGKTISKEDVDYNEVFREGVGTAYGPHAAAIYACYLELIDAAPLALSTPNRVLLAHSLPSRTRLEHFDPAALLQDKLPAEEFQAGGSAHALLWGRDTSEANTCRFLEKMDADFLVTGHIPCEQGYAIPNSRQLILDAARVPGFACLFRADRPISHAELVAGVLEL